MFISNSNIASLQSNYIQSNFYIDQNLLIFTSTFDVTVEHFWSGINFYLSNVNFHWEYLRIEDGLFSKETLSFLSKSQLPILPNELKHFVWLTNEKLQLITTPDVSLIHKSVFLSCKFLIERLVQSRTDLKDRCKSNTAKETIFYGHTPLSLALFLNNKPIYELLIEKGADPLNDIIVLSLFSYNWLKENRSLFLRSLIQSKFLEYQMEYNLDGYSELHLACKQGDLGEVKLLVENGAKIDLRASSGEAPLEICVNFEKQEILDYLLQQGDCPSNGLLSKAIATNKLFAINSFLKYGPREVKLFLLEMIQPYNLPKDKNGVSLLHIFVFKDKIDYVTQLLKKGVDPNVSTTTGITPLHLAALRGNKDMAMLLVEYGANINSVDYTNSTPFLQGLTYFKTLRVSQYLISIGAKTNINLFGLYNCFKQLRLKHIRSLLPASLVFEKAIILRWNEVYLRKICAHIFNIAGTSVLTKKTGEIEERPLILEGLYSPASFLKDVGFYGSNLLQKKGYKNLAELLHSMCLFAAKDSSHSDVDYMQRIQSNHPTFLSTGYWHHGIALLIWGNYYIECDSHSIQVYHYKRDKLNAGILNSLRTSRSESREDYKKLTINVAHSLDFFKTPNDQLLEGSCGIPNQEVGNCMWKSFETMVRVLFCIYKMKELIASKKKMHVRTKISVNTIKQICQDQIALHSYWLLSTKLHFLNSYLDFHLRQENPYEPDAKLITIMLNSLKGNHPSLNSTLKQTMEDILKKVSSLKLPTTFSEKSADLSQKFDSLFGHGFLWVEQGPNYKDFYEIYN